MAPKIARKTSASKIYVDPSEEDDKKVVEEQQSVRKLQERPTASSAISWDVHKENIQPIAQGRKADALMSALERVDSTSGGNSKTNKQQLLDERKEQFEKDLEAVKDDASRQLDLWCDYIDWLEQNVPEGGKVNGVTNAIEQCIELYYDKKEFKQDKRLFNVFMKFKRFCDEPIEIFGFMYANSTCTLLARFYLNWSWQYELRRNVKRAEELLKLGLKNLASPRLVLEEALVQLKTRIERMIRAGELDDCCPDALQTNTRETQAQLARAGIRDALQTLKFSVSKAKGSQKVPINRIGSAVDQTNVGGLKSQVKIVNGVRVASKKPTMVGNKPSQIFNDIQEEDSQPQEKFSAAALAKKVPTKQRIQMVGRTGDENLPPTAGAMSLVRASAPQVLAKSRLV